MKFEFYNMLFIVNSISSIYLNCDVTIINFSLELNVVASSILFLFERE